MTLSQTILATLAYHDIFDYPLTQEEIHLYLVGKKSSSHQVKTALAKLQSTKRIGEHQGYHYLKNRHNIVKTRIQRSRHSRKKYKKAVLFANILKAVPTIRFVAISGALAMQNSSKNDDIDLVIITSSGVLWTTRFLANVILFPFKRQPSPPITINHEPLTNNKACLNIFIDESDLKITPQNLYTAHEICQMEPLWDREQTYGRFIESNQWVYKFLQNWQPDRSRLSVHGSKKGNTPILNHQPSTAEILLKKFQLFYMRKRITTERIGKHQLFFHPANTQDWVMAEYQKRLKKLKISFN